MVSQLQQQLADISAMLESALGAQANVNAAGIVVSYSISTPTGSESFPITEYTRMVSDLVRAQTEIQKAVLEMLQALQPFQVVEYQRVRPMWPVSWTSWPDGNCGGGPWF
jgi:hypothetical protein